jgi:hypothetical protein
VSVNDLYPAPPDKTCQSVRAPNVQRVAKWQRDETAFGQSSKLCAQGRTGRERDMNFMPALGQSRDERGQVSFAAADCAGRADMKNSHDEDEG